MLYLHTGAGRKRFSSAEMREEAEGDLHTLDAHKSCLTGIEKILPSEGQCVRITVAGRLGTASLDGL